MTNDLRTQVDFFAQRMEAKLRKHDRHRGAAGWRRASISHLCELLDAEVIEMRRALLDLLDTFPEGDDVDVANAVDSVTGECADIGNFAMMIADVAETRLKR